MEEARWSITTTTTTTTTTIIRTKSYLKHQAAAADIT
jgi:hypothetical protein